MNPRFILAFILLFISQPPVRALTTADFVGEAVPVLVFNSLSWSCTGPVQADSPFPGEDVGVAVMDGRGSIYPAQNVGDTLYFTARDVPSLGYRVFYVYRTGKPVSNHFRTTDNSIENQFFRITLERGTGVVSSVIDKRSGRKIVPLSGSSLMLAISKGGTARPIQGGSEVVVMERGPARARISFDHELGDSRFTQEIILHEGVPRIDVRTTIDLRGIDPAKSAVKVRFPIDLGKSRATLGNQLGSTDWCGADTGLCGVKWVDISLNGAGVSLLSDQKQDFDVLKNRVEMSLIAGSVKQEDSIYDFDYAIYPHKGNWLSAEIDKRGFEVTYPLSARRLNPVEIPAQKHGSYVRIEKSGVFARLLREPVVDGGFTIRLYETRGVASAFAIVSSKTVTAVEEQDQFENPISGPVSIRGNTFNTSIDKRQIRTIAFSVR